MRNPKTRFNALSKRSSNLSKCANCSTINHKYKKSPLSIDYEIQDPFLPRPGNDTKQVLWPEEAQRILNNITEEHLEVMGLNKKTSNPANMIIENLAVAPPPVRPSVAVTGATRSEDDLTVAYRAIIEYNNYIRKGIAGGLNESQIKELRKQLQFRVATVMDNDISGTGTQKHKTGKPIKAIRARLKGKEGRLRGNLMGKRVDFSARTVITPDPNLRLD
jgi:DNA-directed RNA polymerase II subunit RPB1